MRRYTVVKSNVYAPVSTDLLSQNIIHNHMVSHYRMTYFAKSKVDTSSPWKFKTRAFESADRMRKKINNLMPATPGKEKERYRAELELQKKSCIGTINYDTKQSPTAYKGECIARRQHIVSDPKRKDMWHAEKSANEVHNGTFTCENIVSVPSLNISFKKQRTVPQFKNANWQTWTKKLVCSNKRNNIYGKHKAILQDRLRESISRSLGKSRMYESLQSHHGCFQDSRDCVSSGSEGNAGDDEDGTPTSSCDNSNRSPRENQSSLLSTHKVTTTESNSSHKNVLEKEKQNPNLCLAPIKEAENAESRSSSRDSAYEGGEGMSSTENQRNSPDECEAGSKWFHPCIDVNYENKGKKTRPHASQEESLFWWEKCPSMANFCGNSEFCMKFLQDVTDDVLVQAVYSNEALERIFQDHIDGNSYNLDLDHMKLMIDKLKGDLGIPANNSNGKQMHNGGEKDVSHESILKTRSEWSFKTSAAVSDLSKMTETQFVPVPCNVIGNSEMGRSWTKNQLQHEHNSCLPLINIDQNISMSKREIMDYLSDVGFDHSLSEEIFHTLAGKCSLAPEIPTQRTMKH